jgi:hypothetical protein
MSEARGPESVAQLPCDRRRERRGRLRRPAVRDQYPQNPQAAEVMTGCRSLPKTARMEPKTSECRCFAEQQLVTSMSTVVKFASIAFLGSVLFASSLAPAYALRMPGGSESQTESQQTASAYAGDEHKTADAETSTLSPAEIRHIQWCAARYTLGYDPVSDTYAASGGVRLQCRSSH